MWQRFTERARKVIFYAQEEAQKFGDGYVSTEHLLLGLVREPDSLAAQVIEAMGVSRNQILAEVEKQLPSADSTPGMDMTLTPRAKRVIDLSYDEARNLNNNYIGTEHLLLGLIREGDGLAGRVLAKVGMRIEQTRKQVLSQQIAADRPRSAPVEQMKAPRTYVWDEFAEVTQQTIRLADEMAKAQGALDVTPYYLLKALLAQEDSVATRALQKINVDPAQLDSVLEANQSWAEGAPSITLSPYARQVVDRTTGEASSLGQETVGLEALLLGLVFGNREGIGRMIGECGGSPLALRDAVREMLAEEGSAGE